MNRGKGYHQAYGQPYLDFVTGILYPAIMVQVSVALNILCQWYEEHHASNEEVHEERSTNVVDKPGNHSVVYDTVIEEFPVEDHNEGDHCSYE